MQNKEGTIVFVHAGKSWFLPYVSAQALHASPGSEVVLLGHHPIGGKTGFVPLTELENDDTREFRRRYVHRSSQSEGFELFCWLRWFYLLEYMRREGKDFVLHLDSDVLLYSALDEMDFGADGCDCGLIVPRQENRPQAMYASGHISYWTQRSLADFCAFTLRSFVEEPLASAYRAKWEWHRREKAIGGICDMTTLYLFAQENESRVQNLAKVRNGTVFDLSINNPSNYEEREYCFQNGNKDVLFSGDKPFLKRTQDQSLVRAHALHFQGPSKPLIKEFCQAAPIRRFSDRLASVASALAALMHFI